MSEQLEGGDEIVGILAPVGRDAQLIASMLSQRSVLSQSVPTTTALCRLIDQGLGAVIITEEALAAPNISELREVLNRQAPWSDIPVILLTTSSDARKDDTWILVKSLGSAGNISLLERPVSALTLSSAVDVALRARRRQYEAKSLYQDLERRVEERSSELIAKNQELEGFTYSISHDMRAPLRAIVARASIVLEEESESLSTEGKENLKRLSRAANNMADLVDDLLKYARIGTHQVHLEEVDLEQLGKELAEELSGDYEGCKFDFDFRAGNVAFCDSRLITMTLRNLFDNACKYRTKGKGAEIEFGSVMQDGERVFYVKDGGIGFDMAYVGKLFQPFERLHREEYSGTGIGLANVRRVVERHGGRVWAEGQIDQGSTFYFTIPGPIRPGRARDTGT